MRLTSTAEDPGATEANTAGRPRWTTPGGWGVLTGLSLLPLLTGGLLPARAAINEWQVVVAIAVGAAVAGIPLTLAWAAARAGHPILDAFGRRGAMPMAVLWVIWAGLMGTMNALWAGQLLSAVVPLSPTLLVLAVCLLAAVIAVLWRAGRVSAVVAVVVLTLAASVVVAPHIGASGNAFIWRMPDGYCTVGCPKDGPVPLSAAWPWYWLSLADAAGLAAATVLMWVPVMAPGANPAASRPGAWGAAAQAVVVTGMVFGLLVLSGTVGGAYMVNANLNPGVGLLSVTGPGSWRDVMVAGLVGAAVLWIATVWAAGPPSTLLSGTAKRWITGLAGAGAVVGALMLHPVPLLQPPPALTHMLGPSTTSEAQFNAGLRLMGAAYLIAPLVAVVVLGWILDRSPACRRWRLVPLSGGPAAAIWGIAVVVSTRWMNGFLEFTAGPVIGRLVPGLAPFPAQPVPAPDWAMAIGTAVAFVLYVGTVLALRWRPWDRVARTAEVPPPTPPA